MDQIKVLFDRANRLFRFGDEVTGRVIIDAGSDFTCAQIKISYAWRTHGRGDRDKGREDTRMLAAHDIFIRKGECREFPFRFEAPMGPVSYHGHKLNVDWYLVASGWRRYRSDLKCEEDFLLLAGEPTGAIMLGNKKILLDDLPLRQRQDPPRLEGFQDVNAGGPAQRSECRRIIDTIFFILWISSIIGTLAWVALHSGPAAVLVYSVMALLFGIAVRVVVQNAYKRKLEVGELWVRPDIVFAGSKVNCHLDFRIKREVFLHNIEASIYAKERVSFTRGTASVTEEHVLSKRGFVKAFDEELPGGRMLLFECPLPVPAAAPATFEAANNRVEWFVDLSVNLKGWPGLTKRIPIIVLPG